jgi:hypothetical protein
MTGVDRPRAAVPETCSKRSFDSIRMRCRDDGRPTTRKQRGVATLATWLLQRESLVPGPSQTLAVKSKFFVDKSAIWADNVSRGLQLRVKK